MERCLTCDELRAAFEVSDKLATKVIGERDRMRTALERIAAWQTDHAIRGIARAALEGNGHFTAKAAPEKD